MEAPDTVSISFSKEEVPDLCSRIDRTGQLTGEDREEIVNLARDALADYNGKRGG